MDKSLQFIRCRGSNSWYADANTTFISKHISLLPQNIIVLLIEGITAETTFCAQDRLKKMWHDVPLSAWQFKKIFWQLELRSRSHKTIVKLAMNRRWKGFPQPTRLLQRIRAWSRLHKYTQACINGIRQRHQIPWDNTESFKNRLCKRQWAGDVETHRYRIVSLLLFSVAGLQVARKPGKLLLWYLALWVKKHTYRPDHH